MPRSLSYFFVEMICLCCCFFSPPPPVYSLYFSVLLKGSQFCLLKKKKFSSPDFSSENFSSISIPPSLNAQMSFCALSSHPIAASSLICSSEKETDFSNEIYITECVACLSSHSSKRTYPGYLSYWSYIVLPISLMFPLTPVHIGW